MIEETIVNETEKENKPQEAQVVIVIMSHLV